MKFSSVLNFFSLLPQPCYPGSEIFQDLGAFPNLKTVQLDPKLYDRSLLPPTTVSDAIGCDAVISALHGRDTVFNDQFCSTLTRQTPGGAT